MPYNEFELQVETFGAMAKTEKIAFILEQVSTSFSVIIEVIFTSYRLELGYIVYYVFDATSVFFFF